jgi:hypothetical protein
LIASPARACTHSAISISKVRFRALFAIKRLAHTNKECKSEARDSIPLERKRKDLLFKQSM